MNPDVISRFVADPLELSEAEQDELIARIESHPEQCLRLRELLIIEEALSARMAPHRGHFSNQVRKRMAIQGSGRMFATRLSAATKGLPASKARTAPRRWWTFAAPLAAAALLVLGWFLLPASPEGRSGVVATPGAVVQRGDDRILVSTPWTLAVGDSLSAPADSAAIIGFSDGTRLALGPGSSLILSTCTATQRDIELTAGTLTAAVAHLSEGDRLCVRTVQAEARVIGTRFAVHADGERTRLEVEDGRVAFTDRVTATTVAVGAGEHAAAGGSTASIQLIDACERTDAWQAGSTPLGGDMALSIDAKGHRGACLACAFTTKPGTYPWAMCVPASGYDCRADTGVRFWLRGNGDGRDFCVQILDYVAAIDGRQGLDPRGIAMRFSTTFRDQQAGWRLIELPFASFVAHDTPQPGARVRPVLADVVGVVVFPMSGDGSIALDDLEVYRR
ncbi:MAG: FecR domain-containing protein [Planctomycetes bacterium]|nr:FecR domain-containing protein [Planctomycetota bacterium]